MPNTNWNLLNKIKLGKYAEQFCKMEFSSYGFDVYSNDVDDHGVDFIAKSPNGIFFEIQVKSIRLDKNHSAEISKDKMYLNANNFLICFVIFKNDVMPDIFLLTPSLWNEDNSNPLSKIFHTNPSNYSIRPYANYMDNLIEFKFDKQIYKFM